jgi:hypothetical protein
MGHETDVPGETSTLPFVLPLLLSIHDKEQMLRQ